MNPSLSFDILRLPNIVVKSYFCRPGETDKIALVYETSAGLHRPLLELIEGPDLRNFSLGTRYRLASNLAECVFFLHLTGLLHKGIRSDNVLLSGSQKDECIYSDLKLHLVGFNTARLDQQGEISEKVEVDAHAELYHHIDYQRSKKNDVDYTRGYDIYSLGVVLLEIGLWHPVKKIGRYDSGNYNAIAFASRLQKKRLLDNLNFTAGSAYRRAVEWCLKGPFEEVQGQVPFKNLPSEKQSMGFWDHVVLELAKCSVPE